MPVWYVRTRIDGASMEYFFHPVFLSFSLSLPHSFFLMLTHYSLLHALLDPFSRSHSFSLFHPPLCSFLLLIFPVPLLPFLLCFSLISLPPSPLHAHEPLFPTLLHSPHFVPGHKQGRGFQGLCMHIFVSSHTSFLGLNPTSWSCCDIGHRQTLQA